MGLEIFGALDEVDGGAFFGACFGEEEGAVGELEGEEIDFAGGFMLRVGFPFEAAGDHEVEDEVEVVLESEDDAFALASEGEEVLVLDGFDGWVVGTEDEGAADNYFLEWLVEDFCIIFECVEVGEDVWEFGHGDLMISREG